MDPPKTPSNRGIPCNIKIPASPFLKQLGYGTGVSVLELERSPCAGTARSPWALKMINKKIKTSAATKIYNERLKTEAEILKKLSHPNIVGFRLYNGTKSCLGMEKCDISLRDLTELILESEPSPYTPCQILKVALDIGKALDYIHTKANLLHGDMKSGNVLINGDFEICKLCDFGVALHLDESGFLDQHKNKKMSYVGTELWSAPEIIHNNYPISSKCDLFSFGLVLWEMMSLDIPHMLDDAPLDDSVICIDDQQSFSSSSIGTRPPIPHEISVKQYSDPIAIFYCLTEEIPMKRPTAHHIVLCAEFMMEKEAS